MKFLFLAIGKTHDAALKPAIDDYTSRLQNYFTTDWQVLMPPRKSTPQEQKSAEAELVRAVLKPGDFLWLLDEKGNSYTSEKFAQQLQTRANSGVKRVIFLIGGAYGADATMTAQAHAVWSLSPLTFPHQLVRLILAEQIYRACTILRHEKYHHS